MKRHLESIEQVHCEVRPSYSKMQFEGCHEFESLNDMRKDAHENLEHHTIGRVALY
jgi:hypothetical protein